MNGHPLGHEIIAITHNGELEIDDDPKRFKESVGKLVKHKPVERPRRLTYFFKWSPLPKL